MKAAEENVAPVRKWLEASKTFFPSMIVYNVTERLIGETSGSWKRIRWLTGWDKSIRDESFTQDARDLYNRARKVLARVLERFPSSTNRELIDRGRATLIKKAPNVVQCLAYDMTGARWQAMQPAKLALRDPCSTCQILFTSIELMKECADEPPSRLGDNWSVDRAHQCAEADAHRQEKGCKAQRWTSAWRRRVVVANTSKASAKRWR
jgi:hypothetical protein